MGATILNLSRKNLVSSVFCINYAHEHYSHSRDYVWAQ